MADNILSRKIGPMPAWVVVAGGFLVAFAAYKKFAPKKGGNGKPNASETTSKLGAIMKSPSGSFKGDFTQNVNGENVAQQTSSGPLLTGAYVGVPGPMQFTGGGDFVANFPGAPAQTTTQSASQPTYTVGHGESWEDIAQKYWGNRRLWQQISDANQDIDYNPDNGDDDLDPGTIVTIPTLPAGAAQAANSGGNRWSRDNGDDDAGWGDW